jgi:hypothetical protein
LFDVSKAFARTWHLGIIFKLDKLKVPTYIIHWVNDFLLDRKFFVNINNIHSLLHEIQCGVPQGSTISPTLFSIYITDIDSNKLTNLIKIALYADDLCIWVSSHNLKNIETTLQQAINTVAEFFHTWCLPVNVEKTSYSIFTTAVHRQSYNKIYSLNLKINNAPISIDPYPKLLGITPDPKLSFTQHVQNIIEKATPRINLIRILKSKNNDKKFLVNIYKILIRSLIDYSDFVIATTKPLASEPLQKLQNRALRICLNTPLFTRTMVKDRAFQLSKQYLSKALINNSLIKSTVDDFLTNKEKYEGKSVFGRKPNFNSTINFTLNIQNNEFDNSLFDKIDTDHISHLKELIMSTSTKPHIAKRLLTAFTFCILRTNSINYK